MKLQPDKFFHDKLHRYEKPLKPGAWEKISQNLDRKHRRYLWLKVAASLLLIAAASILIFSTKFGAPASVSNLRTDRGPQQEKTTPGTSSEDVGETEAPVQNRPSEMAVNETTTPPAAKKKLELKGGSKPRSSAAPQTEQAPAGDVEAEFSNKVTALQPVMPELAATEPSTDPSTVQENRKSTTIVFSAEEVNEKYFTKTATAQATPEDDNTSTLKKILDKAYDLKHNQDPIGDLRKRKNELFALNLRSEKQRKN